MLGQFVKFVGVGGINTGVTYIIYLFLLLFFNYQVAYTITYISGIYLAYYLNLKFVFKQSGSTKKVFLFPFVYLVQYLLGILILYVVIDKYAFPEETGPVFVVLLTIPLTYLLSKKILSKKSH